MGDMMPSVAVAMVPTVNERVMDWPLYIVSPDRVVAFKETHDGVEPGLVWVPLDTVMAEPAHDRPLHLRGGMV